MLEELERLTEGLVQQARLGHNPSSATVAMVAVAHPMAAPLSPLTHLNTPPSPALCCRRGRATTQRWAWP